MPEKKKPGLALPTLALLCVLSAPAALADEIVLANGDRLSGKIVHKEGDALVLNTTYAGDVSIKWADIQRITTDAPKALLLTLGYTW